MVLPLQFLMLNQGHAEFLALIDSGAQANLISSDLLSQLKFVFVKGPQFRIRSVSNHPIEIVNWVSLKLNITPTISCDAVFAVIENVKSIAILGLPFLVGNRAEHDCANQVLKFPCGSVYLWIKDLLPHRIAVNDTEVDHVIEAALDGTTLNEVEAQSVYQILYEYRQLFEDDRRGEISGVSHAVRLTSSRPIKSRPRPHTPAQQEVIAKEIKRMLEDKVIIPSESPYSSEVVMVKKKTGDWRMCIDYRPLNELTIADQYPLPRIQELLRAVKGSHYFVALDLRSGYWQILMDPASRSCTAFRTELGLFEFRVMPFGLKTAPATFQRNMDFLLNDLRYEGVLVYIDDILIHHPTFNGCVQLMKRVFERLRTANITINLEKNKFFQESVEYLGHIISSGKIRPNPKKVEALSKIKPPETAREVRSLLGVSGYVQHFVRNYSEIAAPITSLLKGKSVAKKSTQRVEWTAECQQAWEKLCQHVQDAILHIPLDSDKYEVQTDASNLAIGAALFIIRGDQKYPVHFASRKLQQAEINYSTREKEALAIVFGLRKFDYYIKGRKFTLHTDHSSLKYLLKATEGKLARWALVIPEYDIDIQWVKGQDNELADLLSRKIEYDDMVEDYMVCSVTVPTLPSIDDIVRTQQTSPPALTRNFTLRNGTYYYRGKLYVPPELRNMIIEACHLLPPSYHPGNRRTKGLMLRVVNWPGLHDDVSQYIKGCPTCQRLRGRIIKDTLKRQLAVPGGPFEIVHMDHFEIVVDGVEITMLTMVDAFTKWAEVELVPDKSMLNAAGAFVTAWISRFGVPRALVTDNAFAAEIIENACLFLGIRHYSTLPYRPQSNAIVEVFHKHLNKYFASVLLAPNERIIEGHLATALWMYRTAIHTATLETPAYLVYGIDPIPPMISDWRFQATSDFEDRLLRLIQTREDIILRWYNLKAHTDHINQGKTPLIKQGDIVLVLATDYIRGLYAIQHHTGRKLVPKWSLPMRVVSVPSAKTARVKVRSMLTHEVFDVHTENCHPIPRPKTDTQLMQWAEQVQQDGSWIRMDPFQREATIRTFLTELMRPQE